MVTIGLRPGGSSSMTETSRSPYNVMASVRGIGVAVMTSTWGGCAFLVHKRARCATPKRCCSSITTRPSEEKFTVSSITACVPISIRTSPVNRPVRMTSRFFPFTEPVSNSTRISIPYNNSRIVSKCWLARISVGAIIQAW